MTDSSERTNEFSLPRLLSVMFLVGLSLGPALYEGWIRSLFNAYSALFVIGGRVPSCCTVSPIYEGQEPTSEIRSS